MRAAHIFVFVPLLAACDGPSPDLSISNAIVAAAPSSAAVYASIENRGGADRLMGIELDGRVPISLHKTSNAGGVMRMRPVDGLDVPADGRLDLKSGGAHGMAMGRINANPQRISLTFRFARSGPVSVSARLTQPGGTEAQR